MQPDRLIDLLGRYRVATRFQAVENKQRFQRLDEDELPHDMPGIGIIEVSPMVIISRPIGVGQIDRSIREVRVALQAEHARRTIGPGAALALAAKENAVAGTR